MSLKYQRVKQADLLLPTPLRWLTRAFSSITLAVVLLVLVALYGTLASVPIALLVKAVTLAGIILSLLGIPLIVAALLIRWSPREQTAGTAGGTGIGTERRSGVGSGSGGDSRGDSGGGGGGIAVARWFLAGLIVAIGAGAASAACLAVADAFQNSRWYTLHRATVIYRLPGIEMTELEFYSWWPMQLILALFVLNLVWATIRRIEFNYLNLGVLCVHCGIVTLAVGSIFYGTLKLEGDALIWRRDLGGRPVSVFYDRTTPAIYFRSSGRELAVPLPDLPRYNDYDPGRLDALDQPLLPPIAGTAILPPGSLDIPLHTSPEFRAVLGDRLRATLRGFIAYGQLQPDWIDADAPGGRADPLPPAPNPAVRLGLVNGRQPVATMDPPLIANVPALRVRDDPHWAVELLVAPTPDRVTDLAAEFEGSHGLVVSIPARGYRRVLAIPPDSLGKAIELGDTGYRLTVEEVGPYEIPFITPGYEGARDTRAVVRIEYPPATGPSDSPSGPLPSGPDTATDAAGGDAIPSANTDRPIRRRMVMYRYPERSQDFIPPGGDELRSPQPGDGPMMGRLGKRLDPDPAVHLAYIDASKTQLHLIATTPALDDLALLIRPPSSAPRLVKLEDDRFTLASAAGREVELRILQRLRDAQLVDRPVPTPKHLRQPKDEGTYLHALLPVDLEADRPDGSVWRQRLWLRHMRYPDVPDPVHHPLGALPDIPGAAPVLVSFSRQRYELPVAITLDRFEMLPIPGSDIPRDFVSTLTIQPLTADRRPLGRAITGENRLNNPLIANGLTWKAAHAQRSRPWLAQTMDYLRLRSLKLSQAAWDPGDPADPELLTRDPEGRFLHQQRYTVLGVGNNVGIQVIFVGACMVVLGIPWAFYVKPVLLQARKRRLQQQLARGRSADTSAPPPLASHP